MKKRMFLGVVCALATLATGCQDSVDPSRLQAEKTEDRDYIEECYQRIAPSGKIVDGQYPSVAFAQGGCYGDHPVVSKLSRQTQVLVQNGDIEQSSPLFASEYDVQIEVDGNRQSIGSIQDTDQGMRLILDQSVGFQLLVGDEDSLETWQVGDLGSYPKEVIQITL